MRDFLRCHPGDAIACSRLKEELARQFPTDIDGYVAGKAHLVRAINAGAQAWKASTPA